MRMNLTKTRDYFFISLDGIYEANEINSFFYIFCEEVLGFSKIDVTLNQDFYVSSTHQNILQDTISRLLKFEPIQYIYGVSHFYNLKFKVTPEVLIPRPETEELVEIVIKNTKNQLINILDMGTGSGCIAISLAKFLSNANVSAIDISEKALQIAKINATNNGVDIKFYKENILIINSLPENYDIIVSNPPYVRNLEKAEMQPNVLHHEPHQALFVEDINPLIFYDKISKLAYKYLKDNGKLYFEINQYLGIETQKMITKNGFSQVELKKDFFGNDRFIVAEK